LKFAFIGAHVQEFPVKEMCRVLQVSRSGYYAWQSRPESPRAQRRMRLLVAIRAAHTQSRESYGSPRVHAVLISGGEPVCVNTVARLMRNEHLQARTRRKFRVTTDSSHGLPVAPNLLNRDFTASAPNRKWVADITFIPTGEGWMYLAAVLDLHSRRLVGWAMSERMKADLVIAALVMAIETRRPPAGLIHHSDRGSQYASQAFRSVLAAHRMQASMSRKGDVYDNAAMESCFGTIKTELVHKASYATRAAARQAIFEYIEVFYNRQRLHSTLGYRSPALFEQALTGVP
jgi:transposase InsO family protein